nr:hypothetical protein GCM10025699_77180 [Microbacterium flavescens]
MSALTVLFIGGTGIISSAAAVRVRELGHDLTIINRGSSSIRPAPAGVEVLTGDVSDPASIRRAIGDRCFDVVVDFVAFTPDQVQADVDLFTGRVGQYVFISSASAYQKPVAALPIRESSPLRNPYWQYSRDKIACEDLLVGAYREHGFPVTIIRPSHTYDRTSIPVTGGWTAIDRMRRGVEVVVPGDGTSLWTLTHHADFARAFVGLLGLPAAVGDVFHITSDEALPWNQIYTTLAAAARWAIRSWCTWRARASPSSSRSGARGSSATRRTRSCSTTRRSRRSSPAGTRRPRGPRAPGRSSSGSTPTPRAARSIRRRVGVRAPPRRRSRLPRLRRGGHPVRRPASAPLSWSDEVRQWCVMPGKR